MIAALVLAAAEMLGTEGIWLNLSPSMPIGLYLSRQMGGDQIALTRGVIVAVCLPTQLAAWGRSRGYLVRGRCHDGTAPVGKPIFAVAGDTVTVTSHGLVRNREIVPQTGPLLADHAGRALPRLPAGSYPVAPGQLWLVSTRVAESWDSRYYGPLPVAGVVAVLQPLWVARRQTSAPGVAASGVAASGVAAPRSRRPGRGVPKPGSGASPDP